jgi:hypothetical protein
MRLVSRSRGTALNVAYWSPLGDVSKCILTR